MTKCSFLCFIFSLLLLGAVVQSHAQVEFSLGMKAGLNIGTLSFDPDLYEGSTSISKSGVLGFMAGGVAEVGFANMFAVQLEPGYNLKATKWEDTQGGKRTISVGVLQIPILFKTKFLSGPVRPYGFIGPNLGIVIRRAARPPFHRLASPGPRAAPARATRCARRNAPSGRC